MADAATYTPEQIALAARELREAAGADAERVSTAQALQMLAEEVRLLRERGFSDAQIAELLTGFDIPVTAADIAHATPIPRFAE